MSSLKPTGSVHLLPPEPNYVRGHRPAAHLDCVSLGVRALVVTAALLLGGCSTLQRWTTHREPVAPPAAAPGDPQARTAPAAGAPGSEVVPHQAPAVATTVASVHVAAASETRPYANPSARRTLGSGGRNAPGPTDAGHYTHALPGPPTHPLPQARRFDPPLVRIPTS